MSYKCTDWTVLSEKHRHKDSIYQNINRTGQHMLRGKQWPERDASGGCWCYTGVLVMWLHSTFKFIKLHNTMPVVFSVYVMLLKEWKLNKTASMWLHQNSLPITVWWHSRGRILNPVYENEAEDPWKEAWHWKEGWGHRTVGFYYPRVC